MPDEIKNPFDFGTGSIDKDQWLRDIDEGQEQFIGSYGPSLNKHRTALLRQAFADLRRRISNGDMLSRTADGQYQFGSALNRDDKHMQEAYERALGFMGELARRQIKAPTKPEEKKYGTATLQQNWLRYLNPSGKFNEKAYWAEGDDQSRIAEIKKFLEQEKAGLSNFSTFDGYKDRADLEARIKAFIDNPTETNLQRLGFDNKNWITKPVEETETEAKTEKEQVEAQIAAAQEAEQVKQGRRYLNFNNNRGNQTFGFTTSSYNFEDALKAYLASNPADMNKPVFAVNPENAKKIIANDFIKQQQQELNNYFSTFATGWKSIYNLGEDNRNRMASFLSRLFSTYNKGTNQNGTPITDYAFDWKKYFTQIGDNQFLINGSLDKSTGRYAYYVPGEGIKESNVLDTNNQYIAQQLGYTIPSQKEGGKIEFLQQGGGFDYDAWASTQLDDQPKTESKPKQQSNIQFSNSENARIAAVIADIASMGAAFVPGYGTAASAALGLGSTATNFGADISDGVGLWGATKNAGFGLAADVMGLIPGLGGVGKGAKIARNLMWAVPKMMQWVNTFNGLSNAGEIKNSIVKLTSPSSMTLQDWQNVSQALQIMTGHGRSVATKVKKAGMSKSTTTTDPEYYIFTNKGKQKVSDETFKKLREVRGTKARQELTQELMGDGVTLQQTRFAPWNTSTKVGAFKEVPGQTRIEINNKHKGWFSDENLAEGAENINPSIDIRNILYKINPYRGYYTRRNQVILPERNYSKMESKIIGESSPLDIRGPKQPYPTDKPQVSETVKPVESSKVKNNKKKKHRKHEIGGILKTLRNGGIIKAEDGVKMTGIKFTDGSSWYGNVFSHYKQNILDTLKSDKSKKYYGWLNDMQDMHSEIHNMAGGGTDNTAPWVSTAYKNDLVGNYQTLYGQNEWNQNFNELGISKANNTNILGGASQRYDFGNNKRITTDNSNNNWKPDNLYSAITDDRRLLGRVGDYTTQQLAQFQDELKNVGYSLNADANGYYKLEPITASSAKSPAVTDPSKKPEEEVVDASGSRVDPMGVTTKNPFDPTLLSVAAKTLIGLRGNANIYGNLLKEMPQAPLRDPIDRKLAILGWQDQIKQGQNQLADLRNIQQRQQGSDQQTNFATALEAERVGRGIMDDKYIKDAGRQFETAQKSWNIDNEDILYNTKVGDDNRKSIADRARMMAQIRAAWRSGDNNILMGALADTTNWWLKRYQREQDLLDKAKELALGTPEEKAQSDLYENDTKYRDLMDKYQRGDTLTDEEKAYVKSAQAKALRSIRGTYAQSYYNSFHNPLYGGNFYYGKIPVGKDGTKLEVEKLKARGKDNDRFVSMFKDLRKHSYRRRRR